MSLSKIEQECISEPDFLSLRSDIRTFLNNLSPQLGNKEIGILNSNASAGIIAMAHLMNKTMLYARGMSASELCPEMRQMDPLHRMILLKNCIFLCKNIMFRDVAPFLTQEGILTEEDNQHINAEISDTAKVQRLLELLPRKGPRAYHAFRGAFDDDRRVVQVLDETVINESDAEKYSQGTPFDVIKPEVGPRQKALDLQLRYDLLMRRACPDLRDELVENLTIGEENVSTEMEQMQEDGAPKHVESHERLKQESAETKKEEHKYEDKIPELMADVKQQLAERNKQEQKHEEKIVELIDSVTQQSVQTKKQEQKHEEKIAELKDRLKQQSVETKKQEQKYEEKIAELKDRLKQQSVETKKQEPKYEEKIAELMDRVEQQSVETKKQEQKYEEKIAELMDRVKQQSVETKKQEQKYEEKIAELKDRDEQQSVDTKKQEPKYENIAELMDIVKQLSVETKKQEPKYEEKIAELMIRLKQQSVETKQQEPKYEEKIAELMDRLNSNRSRRRNRRRNKEKLPS